MTAVLFFIFFGIKKLIIEEDVLNYSPTVMFRETLCTLDALQCTENVVFIAIDTQILTVF